MLDAGSFLIVEVSSTVAKTTDIAALLHFFGQHCGNIILETLKSDANSPLCSSQNKTE